MPQAKGPEEITPEMQQMEEQRRENLKGRDCKQRGKLVLVA